MNKYNLLGCLIAVVSLLLLMYIICSFEKKGIEYSKEGIEITFAIEVNGIIKEKSINWGMINKGALYLNLDKGIKYSVHGMYKNNNYENSNMNFFLQQGDSIYKKANNDTIYIYRNNKEYYFVMQNDKYGK